MLFDYYFFHFTHTQRRVNVGIRIFGLFYSLDLHFATLRSLFAQISHGFEVYNQKLMSTQNQGYRFFFFFKRKLSYYCSWTSNSIRWQWAKFKPHRAFLVIELPQKVSIIFRKIFIIILVLIRIEKIILKSEIKLF